MSRAKSIALPVVALFGASLLLNVVGAGKVVAETMKPLLVQVVNGSAQPVPVIGVPAEPFRGFAVQIIDSGSVGVVEEITTVPVGKRLVIETMTLGGLSSIGTDITQAELVVDPVGGPLGDAQFYHVAFAPVGNSSTSTFYAGTHNVRIYADAESRVGFNLVRGATTGFTNMRLTVSGYLVDVP